MMTKIGKANITLGAKSVLAVWAIISMIGMGKRPEADLDQQQVINWFKAVNPKHFSLKGPKGCENIQISIDETTNSVNIQFVSKSPRDPRKELVVDTVSGVGKSGKLTATELYSLSESPGSLDGPAWREELRVRKDGRNRIIYIEVLGFSDPSHSWKFNINPIRNWTLSDSRICN